MGKTVIIDYGSGNLHSAHKAFERAASEAKLKEQIIVSAKPEVVAEADRIVLPGVGAFKDCRKGLMALDGMEEAMRQQVISKGRPFLGICVGMQLMATRGLEHETTKGLGWIAGDVKPITPKDPALKIPHMGWNTITPTVQHALLDGIKTGDNGLNAYFVHSYHVECTLPEDVVATADYGGPVTAMIAYENMVGTQFHPEKKSGTWLGLHCQFSAVEAVSGLVPELIVSDLQTSLEFWADMLDFSVLYDRPEEKFAYLRRDICDVMLEQLQDGQRSWKTGELSKPFGRGINFQMENADWSKQLSKLRETAWPFFLEPEEKWYRAGEEEIGQRQFLVQDPDGYLLRLCQPIGRRKLS